MKVKIPLNETRGLTLSQRIILGFFAKSENDFEGLAMTNKQIAEELGISNTQHVSQVITVLKNTGYIEMSYIYGLDNTRGQRRKVYLTEKADESFEDYIEIDTDWYLKGRVSKTNSLMLGYLLREQKIAELKEMTLEEHLGFISPREVSFEINSSISYVQTSLKALNDLGVIRLIKPEEMGIKSKRKVQWIGLSALGI